jgi:hypothetical protein
MIKARIIEDRMSGGVIISEGCFIAAVPRHGEQVEFDGVVYGVQSLLYHTVSFERLRNATHIDLTIGVYAWPAPGSRNT